MRTELIQAILNSKQVHIFPHINPDGDCLGSAYALKLLLQGMGKQAQVYLEPSPNAPRPLQLIRGVEEQADFTPDLIIAVDCGDLERLGERRQAFVQCENTINIDHHLGNPLYAKHNLVTSTACAAGEIVFDLATEMNLPITRDIAINLYIAISSDSGRFAFSNTSPHTHRVAAQLLEHDIDHAAINAFLFDSNPLKRLQLMKVALDSLGVDASGQIAWVSITEQDLAQWGATIEDCNGLISLPRSLETAQIAFCFVQQGDTIKVSLRSKGGHDVSALARQFGGGGHMRASGCKLQADMATAQETMVESAKKLLGEA